MPTQWQERSSSKTPMIQTPYGTYQVELNRWTGHKWLPKGMQGVFPKEQTAAATMSNNKCWIRASNLLLQSLSLQQMLTAVHRIRALHEDLDLFAIENRMSKRPQVIARRHQQSRSRIWFLYKAFAEFLFCRLLAIV